MYIQNTFMNWVNKCLVFGIMAALQLINYSLDECSLDAFSVISDTFHQMQSRWIQCHFWDSTKA